MKLTTFTDYSLRVLIYLAAQPGQRATIGQVAAAYQVSENHLVKVVHFLGKQGWLTNVRGKGGGLELALPPERIGVGQVVRQTEGVAVVAECLGETGGDCCLAPSCRLKGVLGEAITAFYGVLDRYTLADLVSNRQQLARILFIDKPPAHQAPVRKAPARRATA
jgi:Rrf2 family nitric oxide-sensitive transcriptional repressor